MPIRLLHKRRPEQGIHDLVRGDTNSPYVSRFHYAAPAQLVITIAMFGTTHEHRLLTNVTAPHVRNLIIRLEGCKRGRIASTRICADLPRNLFKFTIKEKV